MENKNVIKENEHKKPELKVFYTGSGVKTLRFIAGFLGALCGICIVISLVCLCAYFLEPSRYFGDMTYISVSINMAILSVACLVFMAICRGLATIAEAALYKASIIEDEYEVKQQ
jgi:hypothetical protein